MIMTSPGLPLVGVMESICGGRPTSRELSRTNTMSPATTTVGMNPLLLRIRWCGFCCGRPSCALGDPPRAPSADGEAWASLYGSWKDAATYAP